MNYALKEELFYNACAAVQGKIEEKAEAVIQENEISEFRARDLKRLFFLYAYSKLGSIPDSILFSNDAMDDYLSDLFETYDWLESDVGIEARKSPSILELKDLEDSGYVLEPPKEGKPPKHLSYHGPGDPEDTDDIVFFPFTRRVMVPVDVHAVEKAVESLY